MTNKLNFEFDVRIPEALIQQLLDGEITGAMLLTMNILYKWAHWRTGKVRYVCASSLCYASQKAFSENTFSEALRRLEWMGWITRHMKLGSKKWYPVTLHNYKVTKTEDGVMKVHIINPHDIETYRTFPQGRRDDAVDETVDETWDETGDRHLSLHESEHKSEHESSPKEKREVSKEVSEAQGTSCPRGSQTEEQRQPLFYWSEKHQREFTIEEVAIAQEYLMVLFPRSDLGEMDSVLMAEIALDFQARYPNPLPKDDYNYYAETVAESHACKTIADYLAFNRKHKKGGMIHANVAEFHKAWFSDSDRCARIQWEDHDPAECKLCNKQAKAVATGKPAYRAEAKDNICVKCGEENGLDGLGVGHDGLCSECSVSPKAKVAVASFDPEEA